MGKGDGKTKRGKINRGSYGKSRPHPSPQADANKPAASKTASKKAPASRKKAS